MDLLTELTRADLDPALIAQVRSLIEQSGKTAQLQALLEHKSALLAEKDIKIRALTLELAHHKRIRFANKSEAFTPEQRELFQESWNTDLGGHGSGTGSARQRHLAAKEGMQIQRPPTLAGASA